MADSDKANLTKGQLKTLIHGIKNAGGGSGLPIHVVYAQDPDNETRYSPYIPLTSAEVTAWNNGEIFYVDFSQMTSPYLNYLKPYMADMKQAGYVLGSWQAAQIVQSHQDGDHAFFVFDAVPHEDGESIYFEFENRPSSYIDRTDAERM